jgi:RNA polymerase sigma-70 factor, ECF subfamily
MDDEKLVPGGMNGMSGPEDGALVAQVLNGQKEQYALLVRRHQASLFRHARGFGLDPDTASDMVQDALVRAFESLDTCQDHDRFGFWVARILRNRCLDHLKSAASQRNTSLPPDLPANTETPEERHRRASLKSQLEEALETLPLDQREAFLMKHAEGRPYEEMAELAGTSVSAMKMRVHRAREALREVLEPRVSGEVM